MSEPADPRDEAPPAQPRGRRVGWLVPPMLFAITPLLNMARESSGQFRTGGLVELLLIVSFAAIVLTLLVRIVLGRWPAALTACAATAAVIGFFYVIPVSELLTPVSWRLSRPPAVATAWLLVAGIAIWWLARRPGAAASAARYLTIMGVVLVAINGWPVVRDIVGQQRMLERSRLVRQLRAPLVTQPNATASAQRPDVFLIVLDKYAGTDVLRERFGFDNRPFEDSLAALGFTIPERVNSNYPWTLLSLASLLNVAHVAPLEEELGSDATDVTVPAHLVEDNRAARFFKQHGYRFEFFPSPWYAPTLENRNADRTYSVRRGSRVRRAFLRSEMRRVLWRESLLSLLGPLRSPDADYIADTFAGLARAGGARRPTFVFAHVIAPHEPYVFDAHCRPLEQLVWPQEDSITPEQKDAYVAQVQCVNQLTLTLVRTLLRRSHPPIILLQGDHGTSTLLSPPDETPSVPELRERFGAFGAYRVPPEVAPAYRGRITMVNVLQPLLAQYYGARIARASDDLFFSRTEQPFDFRRLRVDDLESR